MDQPLIYKYRPKLLKEFEIDNKIKDLLETLVKSDMLNILLLGDSGCGKSTMIECILREYYGDDYDNNNILIINSLKDQGISYYRSEVKIFCQTMCTLVNKKKFVVLDDIDNINEQSQQVFRNCIDKYSNNVNFIASCNNTQKVIDSYQSRVMIFKIKPIEKIYLEKINDKITKTENIIITPEANNFLLSICNNSVRSLISYLEKFKLLNKKITYDIVTNICTNISYSEFKEYIRYCENNNLNEAIKLIYKICNRGYSVIDILDNFFIYIKIDPDLSEEHKYSIIKLICKYIIIFYNIHEDEIELALFTNKLILILYK
tara:strand:+ start:9121 stop:10074 length:954 start_codon:yes stop_codon:yes gene_type:complete